MDAILQPSEAVELLCRVADGVAVTIGQSTPGVRGAQASLAESWSGPAAAAALAEVDRLLAERSAIAHSLTDLVVGARQLIPLLQAAEQAQGLIAVLDTVNLVSTVAAVVTLGLDPVADAISVASAAGIDAAIAAGKAELVTWVRLQLSREVIATSLAGVARRTVINTAAAVTWSLGGEAVLDVEQGRIDPLRRPGWGPLPGAIGWALVGGRRGPGPAVPSEVGGLSLSDHLDVRHNARRPDWLIRRLQGQMPELGRTPRMATSFRSAHDVARALDELEAHLPEILAAMANHPGQRVTVMLPLPQGIGVRGWRTVHGIQVPIPSDRLRQIRVVVSTQPKDPYDIISVMADRGRRAAA